MDRNIILNTILLYIIILLIYIRDYTDQVYSFVPGFKRKSDITHISKRRIEIDQQINTRIDNLSIDAKLTEMLLYSLEGGKRVRPIIVLSIFTELSGDKIPQDYMVDVALAIEYFHCASLVFDDIMDCDTTRRGKTSVYAKYGIANAQIISIILCSLAFKYISNSIVKISESRSDVNKDVFPLIFELFTNYANDISLGQYFDLHKLDINIESLIYKKTTSLFEFCFVIPWVYINCHQSISFLNKEIDHMKEISYHIGFIFQVSDDFEDYAHDRARNAKNYICSKGLDIAYNDYHASISKYLHLTSKTNIRTIELNELTNYLSETVEYYYKFWKEKD